MAGRPYALKKAITARRRGFRMKIIMGLGREQNGGASIDKIEHLDDMLVLAFWISGNGRSVECASIWTSCSGSRGSDGLCFRSGGSRI